MSKANIIMGAVVAAVLAVALAFVLVPAPSSDAGSLRAIVHDGDGGTHELPLSQDARLEVSTKLGTNVVAVADGAVCVSEADCVNHDCVRQGKLTAPGRQIICLPHQLWIEVVADGEAAGRMDVNAVADETGDYDVLAR